MTTVNRLLLKPLMTALFVVMCALVAQAQFLRSSYFMDAAQYGQQLNPAMTPAYGYVHLPGVGNTSVSFWSNGLSLNDVLDVIKNEDDNDYFTSDRFISRLKDTNYASINAGTDIIAAGWWHGKTFMTVNLSVKVSAGARMPQALFSFMRDVRGLSNVDYADYECHIGGEDVDVTAYTELGLGYSRPVDDRLTLGGRIKLLLGLGNARLRVRTLDVKTNLEGIPADYNWASGDPSTPLQSTGTASVDVDADLECNFDGLTLPTSGQGYIDELEFKPAHMGISGAGAAIDAGLAWRAVGGLTFSAAVVDLGFIRWSKGSTRIAHSKSENLHFDSQEPDDISRFADVIGGSDPININVLRLYPEKKGTKSRLTSVASTIVFGADYAFAQDKFRIGALYTHRYAPVEAESEVTFSVNYTPSSQIGLTASYSPVLSGGQSLGLAVKAGPLFVGTDYIFTGMNTKCCNALVGLSIPLDKGPQ